MVSYFQQPNHVGKVLWYRAFLPAKCVGANVIITAGASEFLLGYHTANTEEAVKGRDERSAPLTASFVFAISCLR